MDRCKRCIIPKANFDENLCLQCRDNPVVQRILMTLPRLSHYLEYMPVCPRGYVDCVCDPAYIQFYHPEWYKKMHGDKTPLEALWAENGCMDSFINDPEEKYYCYDDEDK